LEILENRLSADLVLVAVVCYTPVEWRRLAFEYLISNKDTLDFKLITTMSAAKFVSNCRNVAVAARRPPVSVSAT
jgi:hypothetical protein